MVTIFFPLPSHTCLPSKQYHQFVLPRNIYHHDQHTCHLCKLFVINPRYFSLPCIQNIQLLPSATFSFQYFRQHTRIHIYFMWCFSVIGQRVIKLSSLWVLLLHANLPSPPPSYTRTLPTIPTTTTTTTTLRPAATPVIDGHCGEMWQGGWGSWGLRESPGVSPWL